MTAPILYLDYDGILHPADVRVTRDEPLRPRVYVRGEPADQSLFRYMSLLELLLAPYPELKIILATFWVPKFGYGYALSQLSPALQARVIGATKFQAPTRFDSIDIDAEGRGLTHWLALDDDVFGWPDERRHQVVAPTDQVLGLAQPGVALELARRLDALCGRKPLELTADAGGASAPRRTIEQLLEIPGVTEAQALDAFEEDARVAVMLRRVWSGAGAK